MIFRPEQYFCVIALSMYDIIAAREWLFNFTKRSLFCRYLLLWYCFGALPITRDRFAQSVSLPARFFLVQIVWPRYEHGERDGVRFMMSAGLLRSIVEYFCAFHELVLYNVLCKSGQEEWRARHVIEMRFEEYTEYVLCLNMWAERVVPNTHNRIWPQSLQRNYVSGFFLFFFFLHKYYAHASVTVCIDNI